MDKAFALVEKHRWYLYGHLSYNDAIAKVVLLIQETNPESNIVVGAVRRVWGEKIPDDDNIADVDSVPGATFSIHTEKAPIHGFFPVTVVHDIVWLDEIRQKLQEAGYEVTNA